MAAWVRCDFGVFPADWAGRSGMRIKCQHLLTNATTKHMSTFVDFYGGLRHASHSARSRRRPARPARHEDGRVRRRRDQAGRARDDGSRAEGHPAHQPRHRRPAADHGSRARQGLPRRRAAPAVRQRHDGHRAGRRRALARDRGQDRGIRRRAGHRRARAHRHPAAGRGPHAARQARLPAARAHQGHLQEPARAEGPARPRQVGADDARRDGGQGAQRTLPRLGEAARGDAGPQPGRFLQQERL